MALPYLVWAGLLTQTGTNPPVVTVLQNTLGEDLISTYVGVGTYALEVDGLGEPFVDGKSGVFISQPSLGGLNNHVKADVDLYQIVIRTEISDVYANGLLDNVLVEARVYP